jgi:ankyrin repeat protein
MLISASADVNARGKYGNALYAASWGGHDKVVEMLMDAGADVNAQGGFCGNTLQAASWGGHDKVVEMLVSAGADVNAQGGFCGNALCAASWECCWMLGRRATKAVTKATTEAYLCFEVHMS